MTETYLSAHNLYTFTNSCAILNQLLRNWGVGMRVSIYLFRAEAQGFEGLLRDFSLSSQRPEERVTIPDNQGSLDCRVWVMPGHPKEPKWAAALSPLVDVTDLKNSNNSVAVLFKVADRFFAVCFGYAQSMLNNELLEPEFGLRVTANMADPMKISAMQVRTVDANSRQQRSQTANRSRVAEFDLEVEREWLRYLKADVTEDLNWATGVGGSQALSLTTDTDLLEFPGLLSQLLDKFESEDYKEKFPYLDNFVPVSKGDPVLENLWSALCSALEDSTSKKIGVACPDDLLGADVSYWKISGDRIRKREPLEELDLASMLTRLPENDLDEKLKKLKITPFDASDSPMRPKRSLTDYFVFETETAEETYALCLGQWFRIAAGYLHEINSRIDQIEDVTEGIGLPPWLPNLDGSYKTETEYNEDVADECGHILLDTKNFMIGGSHQKVEVCDLLTKEYDFVCVKKMEDSPTMSHLFSQAAVSADLYVENAVGSGRDSQIGYADKTRNQYNEKWGDVTAVENNKRMILAIATSKDGPLARSLFFFSKVNLVKRVSEIRKAGFGVALAKISRPTPATVVGRG
ncbi:hypothetical protein G4Z16_15395 [Streptomyces bathyalis]|uniref:Sporadically distributed protein, TIGR04141 family n=1 Tax=Streptomyces bathyalis TaxID=2710756 RepID=A0A7T1T6Z8_9ACTN|nr:TIGR04141 family sporadically distributed protein [Streptomyces bathyalis]QPP07544.1 hypothetical protein G4Z16_15395 [Streptomyces bathyalis]